MTRTQRQRDEGMVTARLPDACRTWLETEAARLSKVWDRRITVGRVARMVLIRGIGAGRIRDSDPEQLGLFEEA